MKTFFSGIWRLLSKPDISRMVHVGKCYSGVLSTNPGRRLERQLALVGPNAYALMCNDSGLRQRLDENLENSPRFEDALAVSGIVYERFREINPSCGLYGLYLKEKDGVTGILRRSTGEVYMTRQGVEIRGFLPEDAEQKYFNEVAEKEAADYLEARDSIVRPTTDITREIHRMIMASQALR